MITNLIFDVGNVLFSYRWKDALIDTGLNEDNVEEAGRKIFDDNHLWVDFDAGLITVEGLIEEYGKLYPELKENVADFLLHPERMPIERPEVWEKMKVLKEKGYKIYLLSNYSEYLFDSHTKGKPFMDILDGRIVSYEVHQVKPGEEIYKSLLEKYNLVPEECIFFDDRPENTEMAEKLGIKSVTVESREHINDVLETIIKNGV